MSKAKTCKAGLHREGRAIRQKRVRKQILGTDEKPRLCVFRSLRYTYAQLISDESGNVLAAASTRSLVAEGKSTGCKESAALLGKRIAELAKEKQIERVVFDRNGYVYHGRVAAVADGAREGGLKF